jgi:hypothetical protein
VRRHAGSTIGAMLPLRPSSLIPTRELLQWRAPAREELILI